MANKLVSCKGALLEKKAEPEKSQSCKQPNPYVTMVQLHQPQKHPQVKDYPDLPPTHLLHSIINSKYRSGLQIKGKAHTHDPKRICGGFWLYFVLTATAWHGRLGHNQQRLSSSHKHILMIKNKICWH